MKITADTKVVVQRTVTVSTETTAADLAEILGLEVGQVTWRLGFIKDWVGSEPNRKDLVPPVPDDDLESDEWTVEVQR